MYKATNVSNIEWASLLSFGKAVERDLFVAEWMSETKADRFKACVQIIKPLSFVKGNSFYEHAKKLDTREFVVFTFSLPTKKVEKENHLLPHDEFHFLCCFRFLPL